MQFVLPLALLGFLLVGLSAHCSASTRDEYFVAGRASSRMAITGSLFATAVGGSATVANYHYATGKFIEKFTPA